MKKTNNFFGPVTAGNNPKKEQPVNNMCGSYDYATNYQTGVKERLEKQLSENGKLDAEDMKDLQYATDYLKYGYDYAVNACERRESEQENTGRTRFTQ